ncbi:MAG: acetylornithine deacetylase [Pseudomonadota bacterium]|jgi:acetylornithine deacetylase
MLPNVITLLQKLIALPSMSSALAAFDQSNMPVIEQLAQWCESLGFCCEIMPVAPGKANLIATLGTGSGGLILSGHTDTVPFDAQHWQSDPFQLTEFENKLYGLGTSDMKGFFALALTAAQLFANKPLKRPLILLATCDEETTMSGAQALVAARRPHANYAVIGEPTGLKPIRLHKGMMMEGIKITGKSGHSSDPALGKNALEAMHQVIGELMTWRKELQQKHQHKAFVVPVPTLNFGHICGGDSPNRICGECELHLDLRPLPTMKLKELREELHFRVEKTLKEQGFNFEMFPLFSGIEAMETPANATIVKICEKLTGYQAQSVAFGTEAPYFQQLGCETIILGAGHIDQAHQPNEFLALDQLNPMIDILTRLIAHFCLEDNHA